MARLAPLAAVIVSFGGMSEAGAQQNNAPQITVAPERTTVAVGEPFWVRVTVTSSEGGASVSLPSGSPFELLRHGGTSTSFSFSSGWGQGTRITRRETIRWQVRATRQGRHTLGPFVVRLGGQQYSGGTAEIQVVPPGQAPAPSPQPPQQPSPFPGFPGFPDPFPGGGPPQPQPQPSPAPAPTPSGLPGQIAPEDLTGAQYDPEMFLRTVVEPARAYVGQQVVMTVYLYTTVQLSNVNVTREPSTDGFWSEDLQGPRQRIDFEDQFVGSTRFRVALLRRSALFPLREGTLTIGPARLEATPAFVSIFNRRAGTIDRQGIPVQVEVSPLPEKGRPAGFHPGNVGRFSINAKVDQRQVKVGEPVNLTLTVSGTGLVKNVKLEPLGEIEGTRMYDPQINDSVSKAGGRLSGRRTWEYLILPQKSGTLEIPSIELDSFDPVQERYEKKRTKAIQIRVTGEDRPDVARADDGDDVAPPTPEDSAPLRSIHRHSDLTTEASVPYSQVWFVLALVLAPLGFVMLVVIDGVRRRRLAARDVIRARKAAGVAVRQLRPVRDGKVEGSEGLTQVMRALNGFFQDRVGEPVAGLTLKELRAFLIELGVPEEMADRVVRLTEQSEQTRYGGGAGARAPELAEEAEGLIRELDRLSLSAKQGGKA